MAYDEFIQMIQDKQLEHSLKLSKQTVIKVDNKTYTKKPLSARQWREIVQLNQKMVEAKTDLERTDILIEMREKGALYYFGISAEVFDKNYEKLYPIIEGCIVRSNSGLSPEIDLNSMLEKYQPTTTTTIAADEVEDDVSNSSSSHKKVKSKK